ncbi:MAG: hypothetical protein H6720_01795 [Sandaracinus sp.]|nr:hypothetical protein [Sandaracinus sp.]
MPLSNGRAFVVCGAERVRDGGNDRDDDYPVFTIGGAPRLGGVAIVDFDGADDVVGTEDDHTIVRVAGTPELPDPRAATLAPDGVSLLVLDANRGLVRIDEELVLHEETLPMEPSYPHVVMETARTFVAGGAEGAVVRVDDATAVLTAYGHVWSALSREDDVVYLGSDEGLVRVTTAGGTLPEEHEAPVAGRRSRARVRAASLTLGVGRDGSTLRRRSRFRSAGALRASSIAAQAGPIVHGHGRHKPRRRGRAQRGRSATIGRTGHGAPATPPESSDLRRSDHESRPVGRSKCSKPMHFLSPTF